MINIDHTNREDVIKSYSHRLLDDMDFDTLYVFAYETLVENKSRLNNTSLENEIKGYYPELLEDFPV